MSNQIFDKLIYKCVIDAQQAEVKLIAVKYHHAFSEPFTAKLLVLADDGNGSGWLYRKIEAVIDDGYRKQQIYGTVVQVDLLQLSDQEQNYKFLYQIEIKPRLTYLDMQMDTQAYLAPDTDLAVMLETFFTALDWSISYQEDSKADVLILLDKAYPYPFRCQYQETDLAFIQRILAEHGVYYYFRYVDAKEQLVITDHQLSADIVKPVIMDQLASFSLATDLADLRLGRWSISRLGLVKDVSISGDNFASDQELFQKKQSLDKSQKKSKGFRRESTYCDEYVVDESQAQVVADLRMELEQCRQSTSSAQGYLLGVNSGDFISVKQADGKASYLVTSLSFLIYQQQNKDFVTTHWHEASEVSVSFSIDALPIGTKFRPNLISPPRMSGLFSGKVVDDQELTRDQQESSDQSKLDKEGYYRVSFGFLNQENSGSVPAKGRSGSTLQDSSENAQTTNKVPSKYWSGLLPSGRPFGGKDTKMEMPILASSIMLSYYRGHPSFPYILGASPDAADGSISNATTVGERQMAWEGAGKLTFTDTAGKQRVALDQSQGSVSSNNISLGNLNGVTGISMASQGVFKEHMLASGYTASNNLPTNAVFKSSSSPDIFDIAEQSEKQIDQRAEVAGDIYHIRKGSAVSHFNQVKQYRLGSRTVNYYPEDIEKYDLRELIVKLDNDNETDEANETKYLRRK